jgi:hypothetical protein
MSKVSNLTSVFASPGAVAREIAERPHWLIPLVIVLIVTLGTSVLIHEYQMEYQRPAVEKVLRDAGRSEEEIQSRFESTPRRKVIGGVAAMAFVVIFMMLIPALILNGISTVAGEKAGFADPGEGEYQCEDQPRRLHAVGDGRVAARHTPQLPGYIFYLDAYSRLCRLRCPGQDRHQEIDRNRWRTMGGRYCHPCRAGCAAFTVHAGRVSKEDTDEIRV